MCDLYAEIPALAIHCIHSFYKKSGEMISYLRTKKK